MRQKRDGHFQRGGSGAHSPNTYLLGTVVGREGSVVLPVSGVGRAEERLLTSSVLLRRLGSSLPFREGRRQPD